MSAMFTGRLPDVMPIGRFGRIGGYIGDLSEPVEFHGRALKIPRSRHGYRPFMRRSWPSQHGRITIGRHPAAATPADEVIADYDHQRTFARVTVFEDSLGVYLAGRVTLRGYLWARSMARCTNAPHWFPGVSPDWRRVYGHLELVGVVAIRAEPRPW